MLHNISAYFDNKQTVQRCLYGLQVVLGCLYIAVLAQLEIPLKPVPVTLHTFAIMTLALYFDKNKACLSTLLYLAAATLGLPVFPSLWSDPLWILHPTAGYCLGFPFAAYAIAYLSESNGPPTFLRTLGSILAGKAIIYLFGIAWLSYFIGLQEALLVGFYPFIFIGFLKVSAALALKMGTNALQNFLPSQK